MDTYDASESRPHGTMGVRACQRWLCQEYKALRPLDLARKFFTTESGDPDPKRVEANKQTMISWLRATAAAPLNEGFVRFLVATSQMHKNIPTHRPFKRRS